MSQLKLMIFHSTCFRLISVSIRVPKSFIWSGKRSPELQTFGEASQQRWLQLTSSYIKRCKLLNFLTLLNNLIPTTLLLVNMQADSKKCHVMTPFLYPFGFFSRLFWVEVPLVKSPCYRSLRNFSFCHKIDFHEISNFVWTKAKTDANTVKRTSKLRHQTVEMYASAAKVRLISPWPWPLTSNFVNLFSYAHSHAEHLCQVSLKYLH